MLGTHKSRIQSHKKIQARSKIQYPTVRNTSSNFCVLVILLHLCVAACNCRNLIVYLQSLLQMNVECFAVSNVCSQISTHDQHWYKICKGIMLKSSKMKLIYYKCMYFIYLYIKYYLNHHVFYPCTNHLIFSVSLWIVRCGLRNGFYFRFFWHCVLCTLWFSILSLNWK